jgi:hypothetical protein
LRVVARHGQSPKWVSLRRVIRGEFRKNAGETDLAKVEALKFNAVRTLSNFLLYEASTKDEQMKRRIKQWEQTLTDALKSRDDPPR